jgi:hypothetical protein
MGIYASEFTDNWSFFLSHFHRIFPIIDGVKVTIISDWSKGLDATLAGELSHTIHPYCYQHLCENLMKLYPEGEVQDLL